MSLARGAVLAVAVLACAWFVVGIRQAANTTRATTAISSGTDLSAARAARIASWLNAAGWLNPDQQVNVLRGQLALDQNQRAHAELIVERVTRKEPDNLQAWLVLLQATLDRDRRVFDIAVKALYRLDPRAK